MTATVLARFAMAHPACHYEPGPPETVTSADGLRRVEGTAGYTLAQPERRIGFVGTRGVWTRFARLRMARFLLEGIEPHGVR